MPSPLTEPTDVDNQGVVTARTVYVSGTLTGTVKIEASPARTGNVWTEVLSQTLGAYDSTRCATVYGQLTGMAAGPVTVKVAYRTGGVGCRG